jgi:hypothetical protein
MLPPIPSLPLNDDTRFLEVEVRWWGTLVELVRFREESEVRCGPGERIASPVYTFLAAREAGGWIDNEGRPILDGEERELYVGELALRVRTVARSVGVKVERDHDVRMASAALGGVFGTVMFVAALLLAPLPSNGMPLLEENKVRWIEASLTPRPTPTPAAPVTTPPVVAESRRRRAVARSPRPVELAMLQGALASGLSRGPGAGELRELLDGIPARRPGGGGVGNLAPRVGGQGQGGWVATETIALKGGERIGCKGCDSWLIAKKPRPAKIKIHADQPVVVGSLDREIIRRVVKMHAAEVRACYERALQRQPGLAGKVVIRFVIAHSGLVQSAKATTDEVGIGGCVAKAARRWRFPAGKGGGIVIVSYPFVFRAR